MRVPSLFASLGALQTNTQVYDQDDRLRLAAELARDAMEGEGKFRSTDDERRFLSPQIRVTKI